MAVFMKGEVTGVMPPAGRRCPKADGAVSTWRPRSTRAC